MRLETAPAVNARRDLEIAGISIALAIHSFDPTKDAVSDSAEYSITTRSLDPTILKPYLPVARA